MAKRRRLRQEVVLIFCTLIVIICGIILVAPTLGNNHNDIIEAEVRQKMVDSTNITELLGSKNINIGESTKIKSLLRDKLPAGLFLSTFDITLDKLTVNYALTERSSATAEEYADFWTLDNTEQIIMYNTTAMFVLVRNLEVIEINVEGYEYPTCIITREAVDEIFGKLMLDIATADEWQQTLITDGVYNNQSRTAFFAEREPTATADFAQAE